MSLQDLVQFMSDTHDPLVSWAHRPTTELGYMEQTPNPDPVPPRYIRICSRCRGRDLEDVPELERVGYWGSGIKCSRCGPLAGWWIWDLTLDLKVAHVIPGRDRVIWSPRWWAQVTRGNNGGPPDAVEKR